MEVDYILKEIRKRVGEIVLTAAIIQRQLSDVFAHIVGVRPSVFTYLGHDLDTSKMITAIKRLVKSDYYLIAVDAGLIAALNKCGEVIKKHNSVAHALQIAQAIATTFTRLLRSASQATGSEIVQ